MHIHTIHLRNPPLAWCGARKGAPMEHIHESGKGSLSGEGFTGAL